MKLHLKKLQSLNKKMCQGEVRSEMSKLIDQMAQMRVQEELRRLEETKTFKEKIKELTLKVKSLQKSLDKSNSSFEPTE